MARLDAPLKKEDVENDDWLYVDASAAGLGELKLGRGGGFDWGEKQIAALAWVASSGYSMVEVALAVGASATTVRNWARHPEFKAAVAMVRQSLLEKYIDVGLRAKEARIAVAEDRLRRMQQVVEERAAAGHSQEAADAAGVLFNPALSGAPGGSSGLVVHRQKMLGAGPTAEIVDEFEVDNASLIAEKHLLEYVSREKGDWLDRSESTVTKKLYIGIRLEDV